jgi:ubiquinone/menaquinone biosynthesis C-methylase UbiE
MTPVDYDVVASVYDKRYETNPLDGVRVVLQRFIGESGCVDAAEVGCGTGHWLAELAGWVRTAAGLDLSAEMLDRARAAAPSAHVVRGRAEKLPWATGSFDRLFCINAMHHFADANAFMVEARRVLRPRGALMIVGLDPHTHFGRWWVYDYFPAARDADRIRYLPTSTIRERLEAVGFVEPVTEVAQEIRAAMPFAVGLERGSIDRRWTSQLMVLTDVEYEQGLQQLMAEQPILHTDLRLYATFARQS